VIIVLAKEYVPIIPILIESLEEVYNKPRPGNHVSDIVICPRERVFQSIDPMPKTMRELNFFTSGRAVHEAYQELFTLFPGRFQEREVWVSRKTKIVVQLDESDLILKDNRSEFREFLKSKGIDMDNDIVAHIDLYDSVNNQPYEAKSSRTAGLTKPKEFHIAQVKYYMALVDAEWGGVFYQFLNHFEDKPFAEFPVHMDKAERQQTLDRLVREIDNYDHAVKMQDPSLARHVMNDGRDWNWKCWSEEWVNKKPTGKKIPQCAYYDKCLEMIAAKGRDAGMSPDLIAKYSP
jgi:hypothetical protein